MARWNDEMLDKLADKVEQLAESISGLTEAFVAEYEENRKFRIESMRRFEQYDRDRADYLEWKKETDQRFNNLLEEVRASNRRIDRLES